ncbi:mechanosensitive ion channel [Verrucomicrobiaceae bacterium R5-34]|uniref:Mechanosensitive ion channel n=1 Tax=Oceaniferula flava TaxID=2800421 RepID=A0AAE2VC09_9BACT|nr:mechanosensitive ion channel domain-containing protein [Oceaniferula flavus]MBK1830394.1 mechanosensitive ion channel [Verrucomicrobiaceae bacterium R5-34]MBK1854486.1 mechanosensitive ion channel [Oceaniferula flavus]MBM1135792.1 mechanosensitive ion channel [Oceaniferula flavus]
MDIDFSEILQQITELATTHGLKFLLALVTLWIGWKVCNMITGGLRKWFDKVDYDEALESFILSLVGMGLKVLLVVTSIGIAGFPTTSFVAILGAAGLAVGMALSGTLQNFAGGVLLLILKPFKVGDVIESQGEIGKVTSIQIFNTIVNTADNKRVILPNGPVATNTVINYSAESTRRVELIFGIGYDDDIDHAKEVILRIVQADERIHKEPEPFLAVKNLGASSVDIVLRVWGATGDFWGITFDLTEKVKKEFDKEGISFPYPQSDVHLHKVNS